MSLQTASSEYGKRRAAHYHPVTAASIDVNQMDASTFSQEVPRMYN